MLVHVPLGAWMLTNPGWTLTNPGCVAAEYSWIEFLFAYLHQRLALDVARSRDDLYAEVVRIFAETPPLQLQKTALHCGWLA